MLGRLNIKQVDHLKYFKKIKTIDQDKKVALKSIVNCKKLKQVTSVHLGDCDGCFEDYSKDLTGDYSKFKARFLHYYIRSFEEWLVKVIERGDVCNWGKVPNRTLEEYFHDLDLEFSEDKVIELVKQCKREDLLPKTLYHLELCLMNK